MKELVFASIAAVGDLICEVLGTVDLHNDAHISTEQIDFHPAEAVERYW